MAAVADRSIMYSPLCNGYSSCAKVTIPVAHSGLQLDRCNKQHFRRVLRKQPCLHNLVRRHARLATSKDFDSIIDPIF